MKWGCESDCVCSSSLMLFCIVLTHQVTTRSRKRTRREGREVIPIRQLVLMTAQPCDDLRFSTHHITRTQDCHAQEHAGTRKHKQAHAGKQAHASTSKHTQAQASTCKHTQAHASIRKHTQAYASIRRQALYNLLHTNTERFEGTEVLGSPQH